MPPFDKDAANTRKVLLTDNTGVELDGQVRSTVWDPNNLAWVRSTSVDGQYTLALDYDASNNPIYVGRASQGTAKASAGWQIRKLSFDANNNVTDVQYAGGVSAFNAIWNNRVSLAYS